MEKLITRCGLIARMDASGLAYQTKALHDLLKPSKTLVIDSTPFNGREQVGYAHWYTHGDVRYSYGFIENSLLLEFIKDIDVVITCEVPYNDNLYRICKKRGIKTILQPNAELNPHILNRRLDLPDAFFLPSTWLEGETRSVGIPTYIVKPPIIEPRKYIEIEKNPGELRLLHFQGRRAAGDRNGTDIVAILPEIKGVTIDIHNQLENEVKDQRDLYEQGHHALLIPRRYGGQCLPMVEGLSYGLPSIMPNIEPNRTELPSEWLTRASKGRSIKTKHRIETYNTTPEAIYEVIERFRDMNQKQYNEQRNIALELYSKHKEQLKLWEIYIKEVMKG